MKLELGRYDDFELIMKPKCMPLIGPNGPSDMPERDVWRKGCDTHECPQVSADQCHRTTRGEK